MANMLKRLEALEAKLSGADGNVPARFRSYHRWKQGMVDRLVAHQLREVREETDRKMGRVGEFNPPEVEQSKEQDPAKPAGYDKWYEGWAAQKSAFAFDWDKHHAHAAEVERELVERFGSVEAMQAFYRQADANAKALSARLSPGPIDSPVRRAVSEKTVIPIDVAPAQEEMPRSAKSPEEPDKFQGFKPDATYSNEAGDAE